MDQTAEKVIDYYLKLAHRELPNVLGGFYLYGSLALGDFYAERSDLDFAAVTPGKLTPLEMDALKKIHKKVRSRFSRPPLSGIYLTPEETANLSGAPLPYYHNGKLTEAGNFENNPVTWFQLKHHALCMFGNTDTFKGTTATMDEVLDYQRKNINSYWTGWIEKHRPGFSLHGLSLRLFPLKTEWGVLGLARQYYTFCRRAIVSKTEAGRFVLEALPASQAKIVREALQIRSGGKGAYRSGWKRAADTLDCMRLMVERCGQFGGPTTAV